MPVWKFIRNLLFGLLASVLIGAIFLFYSLVMNFSNWPWTRSQTVFGEEAFGFASGASKLETMIHAIEIQQGHKILAVIPLGLAPTTSAERFVGYPLSISDFDRLNPSDRWHIGIAGKNAWFVLEFNAGKLVKIKRLDYFGPTDL